MTLIFTINAKAAPSCQDLFTHGLIEPQKDVGGQKTLADLYAHSRVLAFANPDHESPTAFKVLETFLASHGLDPELKSVSIELSSELAAFLEIASVRVPTAQDEALVSAWIPYLQSQAEPRYIMESLIPKIRALNQSRAQSPLILVPIDSVKARHLALFNMNFIGSIDREMQTSENFEDLVLKKWPTHKHLVIYQHAHVLKNLSATGLKNGTETFAPLAWADVLARKNSAFAKNYKVVLLDENSGFNPSGAIDRQSPNHALSPDGFLRTYRNGTITRTDDSKAIADAYLWMQQP